MNIYSMTTVLTDDKVQVNKLLEYLKQQLPMLIDFGKILLIALVVYLVGRKLIRLVLKILGRSFTKSKVEPSVESFLMAVSKVLLNILLLIIVVSIIGVPTSSLVALVGSAGLAIGLAVQGSLSNFAGGVLILLMKPFRLGDYIISEGNEGTVTSIDIFYTRMLTADNRMVVIPNGTLSNSSITNVTNEPIRRLDLTISIDYSENIKRVKDILENLVKKQELILEEYESNIFVNSFDPSAIKIGVRVWVATENYWTLKFIMMEQIKEAFDEHQITIPFEQLDVNIHNAS